MQLTLLSNRADNDLSNGPYKHDAICPFTLATVTILEDVTCYRARRRCAREESAIGRHNELAILALRARMIAMDRIAA